MKVYRPIQSNNRTQSFGEDRACVRVTNGVVNYKDVVSKTGTSCPVGYTSLYQSLGMKSHNGIDMSAYNGQTIYFPVEADCGWWVKNYIDNDGGIGIDIFSDIPIDIGELPPQAGKLARSDYEKYEGKVYVKFRFHHLLKPLLTDSQNNVAGKPAGYRECKVKFGQAIALADNTGLSSGAHLHWSMKIVANNSMTLDADNGYYGAVDFEKWYENKFVLEIDNANLEQIKTGVSNVLTELQKVYNIASTKQEVKSINDTTILLLKAINEEL